MRIFPKFSACNMRKFPHHTGMEETLRSQLMLLAAAFEAATGTSPKTIGKRALNDNTFFSRLETGHGFTIRTFDRCVEWLSANWPEDCEWPIDIERPASALSPFPIEAGAAE